MAKYAVCVPFTGYIYREVEAASEAEATDLALCGEFEYSDIMEMELHRTVCEGNVFHGVQNEIDVREVGSNDLLF